MLKLRARRRIATKAAAAGVVSAGILFGAIPAAANLLAPVPVTYTCTGTSSELRFNIELVGPATNPAVNAGAVITWRINQPAAAPSLLAPSPIALTDRVVIDGQLILTGVPVGAAAVTRTATATHVPVASLTAQAPVPLPTILTTVTPTAAGTFTVKPGQFILKAVSSSGTQATWFTCTVETLTEADAAALAVVVGSASTTPSPSSTPTPTPSATSPTPRQTRTFTQTVTASQPNQVDNTPDGGIATGGGGEMGPDGRILVLTGTALILAAITGGLMLRSRRSSVRD
ncbi:hypothetical protein Aple_011610 [Acrocarpospora pleiomorpha]|uniref:Uncharacterized protein n=1 Tax=Acrocarpospora pleiomorpha TaxID=90975 RepID=A0A5M3XC81_9ACTN|nr:hypothetical protein Aple_011610 [Acrocarpospora pleiomorpha]